MNEIPQAAGDERIRVLIVGESPLVRAGLEAALAESDRFDIVGASNLAGSAALFESTAAAAILMESAAFNSWAPGNWTSDSGEKLASVSLTPREIEVLRLLADGASNKVIAHKLGISDHTVKFHVTSILSKMNAGTAHRGCYSWRANGTGLFVGAAQRPCLNCIQPRSSKPTAITMRTIMAASGAPRIVFTTASSRNPIPIAMYHQHQYFDSNPRIRYLALHHQGHYMRFECAESLKLQPEPSFV